MKRCLLFAAFLVAGFALPMMAYGQTFPAFSGGSGTEQDPYRISTTADLDSLAAFVNADTINSKATSGKYWKLMNDLDYGGGDTTNFTPIGGKQINDDNRNISSFQGNFDGDRHVVSGIMINEPNADRIGLFGMIMGATMKNIGIINSSFNSNVWVGALVGYINGQKSTITNCYSEANVSGVHQIGGLIGGNYCAEINNCYATGNVSGDLTVGGFIGIHSPYGIDNTLDSITNITNCYATGNVSGNGDVGGFIGAHLFDVNISNDAHNAIRNCYSTGNVEGGCGTGGFGGFAGQSQSNNGVSGIGIFNCYSVGNVSHNNTNNSIDCIGGFIGCGDYSTNCFYLNTAYHTSATGTAKTVTEMRSIAFVDTLNNNQTPQPWKSGNGFTVQGFPALSWQTPQATMFYIRGYNVKKAGNSGINNIMFEGYNFAENTKITLAKDGEDTIKTDTIIVYDAYQCSTQFNFTDKAIGKWDIVVDFGDTIIVISNGLEIEQAKPIELSVEIIGNTIFRSGTPTTYIIQVKNKGNTTAYQVPLAVSISHVGDSNAISSIQLNDGDGSDALKMPMMDFSIFPEDVADSVRDFFRSLDGRDCFFKLYDSETDEYFYNNDFIIGNIAPNSTYTMIITIRSTRAIDIKASVPKHWEAATKSEKGKIKNVVLGVDGCCVVDAIECVVNGIMLIPQIHDILSGLPIQEKCLIDILKTRISFILGIVCIDSDIYMDAMNADKEMGKNYLLTILSNILNCIDVESSVKNTILKLLVGKISYFLNAKDAFEHCGALGYKLATGLCNDPSDDDDFHSNPVNSFDPNDKIGYRSPAGSTYFKEDVTNFTYIINFENADTATAAAQEVYITDTLDMNAFDIHSFRAGFIKIGDRIMQAPYDAQNHTWEIDMRPEMELITTVALSLDTNKGIARWYFKSIDPATGELTTDPYAGFLPPNDSLGSGQGIVSFTIDLKEGISDDATISNRAEIVFDYNEPIITPTWENKKDIVAPTSSMLQPVITSDSIAVLKWQGTDNQGGSGVYQYNVFMKQGAGEYSNIVSNSQAINADFKFMKDTTYSFYVTAVDSAGNMEVKQNVPDIMFTVQDAIVKTSDATNITQTTAQLNGNIVNVGYPAASSKGFEWSLTSDFANKTDVAVSGTVKAETYHTTLTDLTAGTIYYYKAYVVVNDIRHYGDVVNFETEAEIIEEPDPEVILGEVSNVHVTGIDTVSATLRGTLVSLGNAKDNMELGFVYSTNNNPTYNNAVVAAVSPAVEGNYYAAISNLTPDTKYYVRGYFKNEAGIAYSDEITFTTDKSNVGISENNEQYLSIYPNPADNKLTIDNANRIMNKISLFNVDGKLIATYSNIGATSYVIDISKLAVGTYTLNVDGNTLRFVIKR